MRRFQGILVRLKWWKPSGLHTSFAILAPRMSLKALGTISTLIVDDEPLAREELSFLLKDFADIELLDTASNGLEAVKMIEDLEPDLVFLDVQMPGLDGLGVIRKLQERNIPLPYFVLSTAFDQYAVEAFRLEAMDYVLKPIEKERLAVSIDRARKVVELRQAAESKVLDTSSAVKPALQRTKLAVRSGNRNLVVDANDVIYATIDDGLITVVATNVEGYLNYRTIEELQSNLDPNVFLARASFLSRQHQPHSRSRPLVQIEFFQLQNGRQEAD